MDTTAGKILASMFSDVEGERMAAANALVSYFKRQGVHPSDVYVVHGQDLLRRQHEQIASLMARVEEQAKELAFLRAHVDPVILRQFDRSTQGSGGAWFALAEVAIRALCKGRPPKRGLEGRIADALGVPIEEVRQWRDGKQPIPEEAMQLLMDAPRRPARKVKKAKRRETVVDGRRLSPSAAAVYEQIKSSGARGASTREITATTGMSSKTVTARYSELTNSGLIREAKKASKGQGAVYVALDAATSPEGADSTPP
ncbi:MAG: hypothetical protein ACM33T_10155 [Solirubrobacterales bacterium]